MFLIAAPGSYDSVYSTGGKLSRRNDVCVSFWRPEKENFSRQKLEATFPLWCSDVLGRPTAKVSEREAFELFQFVSKSSHDANKSANELAAKLQKVVSEVSPKQAKALNNNSVANITSKNSIYPSDEKKTMAPKTTIYNSPTAKFVPSNQSKPDVLHIILREASSDFKKSALLSVSDPQGEHREVDGLDETTRRAVGRGCDLSPSWKKGDDVVLPGSYSRELLENGTVKIGGLTQHFENSKRLQEFINLPASVKSTNELPLDEVNKTDKQRRLCPGDTVFSSGASGQNLIEDTKSVLDLKAAFREATPAGREVLKASEMLNSMSAGGKQKMADICQGKVNNNKTNMETKVSLERLSNFQFYQRHHLVSGNSNGFKVSSHMIRQQNKNVHRIQVKEKFRQPHIQYANNANPFNNSQHDNISADFLSSTIGSNFGAGARNSNPTENPFLNHTASSISSFHNGPIPYGQEITSSRKSPRKSDLNERNSTNSNFADFMQDGISFSKNMTSTRKRNSPRYKDAGDLNHTSSPLRHAATSSQLTKLPEESSDPRIYMAVAASHPEAKYLSHDKMHENISLSIATSTGKPRARALNEPKSPLKDNELTILNQKHNHAPISPANGHFVSESVVGPNSVLAQNIHSPSLPPSQSISNPSSFLNQINPSYTIASHAPGDLIDRSKIRFSADGLAVKWPVKGEKEKKTIVAPPTLVPLRLRCHSSPAANRMNENPGVTTVEAVSRHVDSTSKKGVRDMLVNADGSLVFVHEGQVTGSGYLEPMKVKVQQHHDSKLGFNINFSKLLSTEERRRNVNAAMLRRYKPDTNQQLETILYTRRGKHRGDGTKHGATIGSGVSNDNLSLQELHADEDDEIEFRRFLSNIEIPVSASGNMPEFSADGTRLQYIDSSTTAVKIKPPSNQRNSVSSPSATLSSTMRFSTSEVLDKIGVSLLGSV